MKSLKFGFAITTLAIASGSAFAQQPAQPKPSVPGAPPATTQKPAGPAELPKGKVAVINTATFQEQVGEFRAKVDALNRQFESRVKEVQSLADKIGALENTLKSQGQVLNAATVAEKTEQLESMKKEHQRKVEDLQADAGRAREKAFEPITAKLSKFAEDYTARHGIVLLVDIANGVQAGVLVWFDPRTNVTKDFIDEYNKANPVPAAAPAK